MVDIIIIILLCFGFLIGFKRGFTRQLVSLLGIILMVVLSYVFKDPLAVFMYNHFPFLSFGGLSSLNILFYEIIAFVIVFSILSLILKLLMMLTNVFEKILSMTILLGVPSKILGGLLGLVENYIIVFIALYFLSFPLFGFNLNESKLANFMLKKTPVLSNICNNSVSVSDSFKELMNDYDDKIDKDKLNNETLKLFTKYDLISKDNVDNLIKKGKL